jgi:acetolactate synthase regulatory subunit
MQHLNSFQIMKAKKKTLLLITLHMEFKVSMLNDIRRLLESRGFVVHSVERSFLAHETNAILDHEPSES